MGEVSSGYIEVDQSNIRTQARNTIRSDIDAVIELVTNSSDALFGHAFTEFMEKEGCNRRYPCIPTIREYEKWREKIAENKLGEIRIRIEPDRLIVKDNGPGIPPSFIETRIKRFGRSIDPFKEMGNTPDFHRRGQFSRGLKEVFAWLHDQGKDIARIEIESIFVSERSYVRYRWKGAYIISDNPSKPFYFEMIQQPEVLASAEEGTGTIVTLFFPKGLIHPQTFSRKFKNHYKLQRIFEEHKVIIEHKRYEEEIKPFKDLHEHNIVHEETFNIPIPAEPEEMQEVRDLLRADSFEMKVTVYRYNLPGGKELGRLNSLAKDGVDKRGIYFSDYTTIYGRTLFSDNVLGTEYLQAEVIIPCLRVFSILGVSSAQTRIPAFTPPDRKEPNWNHPIIELARPYLERIWDEIVSKEAQKRRSELKAAFSRRSRLMIHSLKKTINEIIASEITEIEGGAAGIVALGSSTKNKEGASNRGGWSGSSSSSTKRKKTAFGPQRISYGENILISPGQRTDIIAYFHKEIINARRGGDLHVETEIPILIDENLKRREKYISIPFQASFSQGDLFVLRIPFQPSLELDVPLNVRIRIWINSYDLSPELLEFLETHNDTDDILNYLRSKVGNKYFVPYNLKIISNDGSNRSVNLEKKLMLEGYVAIRDPIVNIKSSGGFIENIIFETEEEIKKNSRLINQKDLDRAWEALPSLSPVDTTKTSYIFRIFCRSKYFLNTFNPELDLTEQNDVFKVLLGTALTSALAQTLVQKSEEPPETHLDLHAEKINGYLNKIMKIINDPYFLDQVK